LTTDSDVAALGKTTSSDSSISQEVRSESAGIDEFDSTVARSVFGSTVLEPVFGWHRWFLSYNVEGWPSESSYFPWFMRHLSG
jgi:hypothetical protein